MAAIEDSMTASPAVPTAPPQAWAHRQGKISIKPLAPADWSPAALAARAQIADAFYRFGICHDEARVEVLVSCFTEDVVFEVARAEAQGFAFFRGRAALFDGLTNVIAGQGDQRRHAISNVVVEALDLDAGQATALAYGVVTVAADGLRVGTSVIYTADLVREADGCWRFSYFYIGMDA
jgi:hypothetical protein